MSVGPRPYSKIIGNIRKFIFLGVHLLSRSDSDSKLKFCRKWTRSIKAELFYIKYSISYPLTIVFQDLNSICSLSHYDNTVFYRQECDFRKISRENRPCPDGVQLDVERPRWSNMYFIKNSFYTFYSIHNELIDIFIRMEGFVEQTEKILFFLHWAYRLLI